MKWRQVFLLVSLVASATFAGCASDKKVTAIPPTLGVETKPCPSCRGASAPGSSIKCGKCDNTGVLIIRPSVEGVQFKNQ